MTKSQAASPPAKRTPKVVKSPPTATTKPGQRRDMAAVRTKSRAIVADFWRTYDLSAGSSGMTPAALAKLKQDLLPDMSPTTWSKLRATKGAQRPRAWFNERTLAQLRDAIEQLEGRNQAPTVAAERPTRAVSPTTAGANELSPMQEEVAARAAARLSDAPLYAVQHDGATTTFVVADSDARTARDVGMEVLHTALVEARNEVIADLAAALAKTSKMPEWLRPDVRQEFAPESMQRILAVALQRAGLPSDAAAGIHIAASNARNVGYSRA